MSDLRKAAEIALEALENVYGKGQRCEAAIKALRKSLAPEVTPEVTPDVDKAYTKNDTKAGVLHKKWVGLTEEELSLLWLEYHGDNFIADGRIINYEKALEAKLKEKNVPQP